MLYHSKKKYNKIISIVLSGIIFVISMLSLNGCSSSNPKEVGATAEQIVDDISNNSTIKHCYDSKFVKDEDFVYVNHEIIKRQTNAEEKEDLIFSKIKVKNSYFSVELEAKLLYNYYDQGGWILDEVDIENKKAVPIGPADQEEIFNETIDCFDGLYDYAEWQCTMRHIPASALSSAAAFENSVERVITKYVTNFKILGCDFDESALITKMNVSFTAGLSDVKCYNMLKFNEKTGWEWYIKELGITYEESDYATFIIDEVTLGDYSDGLGVFEGDYLGPITLTVTNIDEENKEIIYYWGSKEYIDEFHPIGGWMYVHGRLTYYNPNTKCWEDDYGTGWK